MMLVECLAQGYCRRGRRLLLGFPSQRVISNKAGDALKITRAKWNDGAGDLFFEWERGREQQLTGGGLSYLRATAEVRLFEVKLI